MPALRGTETVASRSPRGRAAGLLGVVDPAYDGPQDQARGLAALAAQTLAVRLRQDALQILDRLIEEIGALQVAGRERLLEPLEHAAGVVGRVSPRRGQFPHLRARPRSRVARRGRRRPQRLP